MKKQGNREVFQQKLKEVCKTFNCGTSEKMWVCNYNFAKEPVDCLHNSTIENQKSQIGQAIKSARGMPWHQEPTKDVTSCDKLRGGANIL